jgi:hypothetical protein
MIADVIAGGVVAAIQTRLLEPNTAPVADLIPP